MTDQGSALVDDLLRPVRLARDVERGLLGHILGRLEWPEQRYPMLAAWTEQWSRPAGEQHDNLPLVHARHPQPVHTTTRVEVHPVALRRADPPRPVPVVQAERRRGEPTRVTTPSPRHDEPAITHASASPAVTHASASPASSHPPASPAPPSRRDEPTTPANPRTREPASTRATELPRVVSAFRRDRPQIPGAPPVRPAPTLDLSPGPGDATLTHAATRTDMSPRSGDTRQPDLSPGPGRVPAPDLSPSPGEPSAASGPTPRPPAVALRSDAVTIDPPLVHTATSHEPAATSSTAHASAPQSSLDVPRSDAPRSDAPRLASSVPRVAATASATPADPQLVHAQAASAAPTIHPALADPAADSPDALPHPTARPPVARSRRAVTARSPQPTPTIAARWVADDDAPPLHRPRTTARASQPELPHVVTPQPVTAPARRPVPEASPVATTRPAPLPTTTTTTTQQPVPRPALDVDAVVDTTMRRLGRELERARGLRKALR